MFESLVGGTPTLLSLAMAVFLIIVFAKYVDIKKKAEKGFSILAGGGLFFLVAATFKYLEVWQEGLATSLPANTVLYGQYLFGLLGWLFVLIGACWITYELVAKK
ncbi:MAG: hypothetical protein J7L23_05205 [Candidatus Diapherotrites archaeon]|nr:hypothetical protein [Candidatus Diapherotrites archaeon]